MMQRVPISEAISFVRDPVKIALAIVKDEGGLFNAITLEWYMRTSIDPPMFAISVGHTRYSYECLLKNRYFNLCFPSPEQKEGVKICGSLSGKDNDKLALAKFDFFPGRLQKYPIIRGAAANFECVVISQVRSGDHTIFAGEVKHSWIDSDQQVMTYSELLG